MAELQRLKGAAEDSSMSSRQNKLCALMAPADHQLVQYHCQFDMLFGIEQEKDHAEYILFLGRILVQVLSIPCR